MGVFCLHSGVQPLSSEQALMALLTNYLDKGSIYNLEIAKVNGGQAFGIMDRQNLSLGFRRNEKRQLRPHARISTEVSSPPAKVTRAEFSVILLRLLGLEDNEEMKPVFSDVSRMPGITDLLSACIRGSLRGGLNTFLPKQEVTAKKWL